MLKQTLLATTFLITSSSFAFAGVLFKSSDDKTSLELGASLTAPYSLVRQKGHFQNLNSSGKEVSSPTKNSDLNASHRFAISSNLSFELSRIDEANKYGIYVKLNTNTSERSAGGRLENADKAMIYLENYKNFGRFEAGSYDGAYKTIKITPSDLAAGTGGIDGDFSDFFARGAFLFEERDGNRFYHNASGAFYTSVNLPGSDAKRANKVTYYMPKFGGFSAGLSFIPDTDHQGTIFGILSSEITKKGLGYTDVVEAAAKYENTINKIDYGFSVVGNFGKAKDYQRNNIDGYITPGSTEYKFKRNNLAAVEVGAVAGYENFKLSASYGYLGKSGGFKSIVNEKDEVVALTVYLKGKPSTHFYSVGSSLKLNDKLDTSVTYLESSALGLLAKGGSDTSILHIDEDGTKNKFKALSFGANYKITENISAFAEYTHFKYSKNSSKVALANVAEDGKISLNSGNVVLTGIKAKF